MAFWLPKKKPEIAIAEVFLYAEKKAYCLGAPYKELPRKEIRISDEKMEIKALPYLQIEGEWPRYSFHMEIPEDEVAIDLVGVTRKPHLWNKGKKIFFFSYYSAFHTEFEGTVRIKNQSYNVSSVGDWEHLWGTECLLPPFSSNFGYWHYEPLMWNDNFTSILFLVNDPNGKPVVAEGATTIPDGEYHGFESCKIEYLKARFDKISNRRIPAAWKVTLTGSDGTFIYSGAESLPEEAFRGGTKEGLLYHPLTICEGVLKTKGGEKIKVKGKGISEYQTGYTAYDPLQSISLI